MTAYFQVFAFVLLVLLSLIVWDYVSAGNGGDPCGVSWNDDAEAHLNHDGDEGASHWNDDDAFVLTMNDWNVLTRPDHGSPALSA